MMSYDLYDVNAIKDSGERRVFDTGSVRDMSAGKGRFDLMPLGEIYLLSDEFGGIFHYIDQFQKTGEYTPLRNAAEAVVHDLFITPYHAFIELSKHFENGLKKYGQDNWKHGIPASSYCDSALRHYCKHKAGYTDEPHAVACLWNLVCCMWTIENRPEMNVYSKEEKENAE